MYQWGGLAQDMSVPGDYDGDGKSGHSGVPRRVVAYSSFLGWRSDLCIMGRTGAGHTDQLIFGGFMWNRD